jgi:hypothetical protein
MHLGLYKSELRNMCLFKLQILFFSHRRPLWWVAFSQPPFIGAQGQPRPFNLVPGGPNLVVGGKNGSLFKGEGGMCHSGSKFAMQLFLTPSAMPPNKGPLIAPKHQIRPPGTKLKGLGWPIAHQHWPLTPNKWPLVGPGHLKGA